jgi:CheY-like chemotaxis protein
MTMNNLNGLRALVVEDDRVIQTIIKANLQSVGIPAVVANNGIEAIESLKIDAFDFILMDIRMPDQDGLDATRWIRELEVIDERRSIPIFALTTFNSIEHTNEIKRAGMDEHLTKPFQMDKLLPILEKYFPAAFA